MGLGAMSPMSFLAVSSISRLKKVVVLPSDVFLYPLQLDRAVDSSSSSSSSGSSGDVVDDDDDDDDDDDADGLGIGGAELDEGVAYTQHIRVRQTKPSLYISMLTYIHWKHL